eukprot:Gb_29156 [translate_table: standard]
MAPRLHFTMPWIIHLQCDPLRCNLCHERSFSLLLELHTSALKNLPLTATGMSVVTQRILPFVAVPNPLSRSSQDQFSVKSPNCWGLNLHNFEFAANLNTYRNQDLKPSRFFNSNLRTAPEPCTLIPHVKTGS